MSTLPPVLNVVSRALSFKIDDEDPIPEAAYQAYSVFADVTFTPHDQPHAVLDTYTLFDTPSGSAHLLVFRDEDTYATVIVNVEDDSASVDEVFLHNGSPAAYIRGQLDQSVHAAQVHLRQLQDALGALDVKFSPPAAETSPGM